MKLARATRRDLATALERLDAGLRGLLHSAVAIPAVYDFVQRLAGGGYVDRNLEARIRLLPPQRLVVDLGGGTGSSHRHLPPAAVHLCLDVDRRKLRRLRANAPRALALEADATRLPLRDGSAGMVLVKHLGHHLEEAALERLFAEAARVLEDDGRLVLVEPVWSPRRWLSRLLWHYDRGAHPRTARALRRTLEAYYRIVSWERIAFFHAYVLAVAVPETKR